MTFVAIGALRANMATEVIGNQASPHVDVALDPYQVR